MTTTNTSTEPPGALQPLRLERRWPIASSASLIHALGLVILLMGFNGVGLAVIAPAVLGDDFSFEGRPREFLLVGLMMLAAASLIVGVGLCRFGRISLADLGWRRWNIPRAIGAGLVGFASCFVIIVALTALMDDGTTGIRSLFATMGSYTLAPRLLFLLLGIGAAFSEESIFRGYLQPAVTSKVGAIAGVVLQAGVFALYHMQFSPPQLAGRFCLGLVYGILRSRCESLVAPATAHLLVWVVIGSA